MLRRCADCKAWESRGNGAGREGRSGVAPPPPLPLPTATACPEVLRATPKLLLVLPPLPPQLPPPLASSSASAGGLHRGSAPFDTSSRPALLESTAATARFSEASPPPPPLISFVWPTRPPLVGDL